jgi:outer membrane biosynthesis protein TonB
MSEPKPFASLSSGLLARKGAAKPAMRPQGYGNFGQSLEDLGWDDMGYAAPQPTEHVPSSISALTPAPGGRGQSEPQPQAVEAAPEPAEVAEPAEPAEPQVVVQRRALEKSFETEAGDPAEPIEQAEQPEQAEQAEPELAAEQPEPEPEPEPHFEPAPVVRLPKRVQAVQVRAQASTVPARAKAAFTLRLDADRHLRLRLACAVTRRSAQQIVTGALDEYLSSLPELDALAEHVPAGAGKRA